MFQTFASAALVACASASISDVYNYSWYLPDIEFTAIEQSFYSRYTLKGKYGPNNNGYWGQNAYIFLEVGGDEIADGAVVATWATVARPEEFTTSTDPFTGEVKTTKVATGVPYIQTETAECAVIYRDLHPTGGNDVIYQQNGDEGVAYNAPSEDVRVRSWAGKIQNNQYTIGR